MRNDAFPLPAILCLSIILFGCATPSSPPATASSGTGSQTNQSYTENISSILISQDNKTIVVATEKFHYIFDAPPIIVSALKSSFHSNVAAELTGFHVAPNGKTQGKFRLKLNWQTPLAEQQQALDAGFRKTSAGEISAAGELNGQRYSSSMAIDNSQQTKLNTIYQVKISLDGTTGSAPATPEPTPVRRSSNGGLSIFALPLIPLVILLFPSAH